jgi:CHAT domain-containing protein/Tfp pilus assembly protein PilF
MNTPSRYENPAPHPPLTKLSRLCLLLLVCLCVAPQKAAGQEKGTEATEQSADLKEASDLNQQVVRLYTEGKYEEAIPIAERALDIREKALGPVNPDVATSLYNLAQLYRAKGDYSQAEPLYKRAIDIREKTLGPESPKLGNTLNTLAMLYDDEGDYAQAEPLYKRALAIWEEALGPESPDVASALNNLAGLYRQKGDYAQAEPLYKRALAIKEKVLGPEHVSVATSLNNLALLYQDKGDYAQAEPLYRRALAIDEKARRPEDPKLATDLNNLATLYDNKGDYGQAEQLYSRALAIDEKALGPDHPGFATDLNNLAGLYVEKGDYARAEPLYRRALSIDEKALGPDHPDVATALNGLAEIYIDMGDYARAEPFLQRTLSIDEKALGPDHPYIAKDLANLALLYTKKGDYAQAEPLLQRGLTIYGRALGPNHPDVATALNNLAAMYWAEGDYARAVQFLSRAQDIRERNLSLVLSAGSERQKLAYVATLYADTSSAVSLHTRSASSDLQALRLALTTVLRRKGRALDVMADQIGSLRRRLDPQDRALLDQLSAAQAQLSALTLGGPRQSTPEEYEAAVARLEAEVERLQDEVSSRSAEFRVQTQPVTIEQVQKALPPGAALVEFFSYYPYNVKAKTVAEEFGASRYVAYVLKGEGEPLWADLGEAKDIDSDVMRLRAALKDPARKDVKELARALDDRVMRPVRKLLGNTRRVFLSPDGSLNLVPFAALVDESGKYLVESYSITYLTSGRDLLRLQLNSQSRQPPVVMADPLFGPAQGGDGEASGAAQRRSADMSRMYFPQLPGTAEEAKAVGPLLPGATVLTQAEATEAALKRVSGPSILHIATHGFFLPDQPLEAADSTRGMKLVVGAPLAAARVENPLLRSGIALEGANQRSGAGGEDGILTALEAAGLDLWGTKLVVLSACETGLGEVQNGEGVYGLRRALVLAGSESQVMSLWKVSDEGTRDLMAGYYKRLRAGEGRTEALRQVQLEMLKSGGAATGGQSRGLDVGGGGGKHDYSHPFFWAAFIQSGDWREMGGQAAPIK